MSGVSDVTYDTVIRNGRWFDGTGAPSAVRTIGIRDGHVAAVVTGDLDETDAQVIDATDQWVLPGMIDIHTHYDVEVLGGPALSESLRHGVTTVLLGSCSLSTVYLDAADAGDIFGRVEAIPRDFVIEAVEKHKDWTSGEEYIAALESRPLGPNVAAFLGHSDMRAATMGLDRATRRTSVPPELSRHGWNGCWSRRCAPDSSECPRSSCFSTSSMETCAGLEPCRRPTPSHVSCAG